MSKHRKTVLRIEALEGRELLSAMATDTLRILPGDVEIFGYVAPGSKVEPKDQGLAITMGYGPPTPPPPVQANIWGGVFGPSVTSIGGSAYVQVVDTNQNWKIKHVTYEVSGALLSQTLTTQSASYTRFHPISKSFPNGVDVDGLSLTWDENPGAKSVKITATYNDPGATKLTFTTSVTTVKPEITSTTLYGNAIKMGPQHGQSPTTSYGITNVGANGSAGVQFESVVASTPSSGKFVFVQLMTNADLVGIGIENGVDHTYIETLPDSGPYLDIVVNQPTPFMNNMWTTVYNPIQSPTTLPIRWDSPGVAKNNMPQNPSLADLPIYMSIDYAFDAYLVWEPEGGSYVAVDHIAWTMTATAVYMGPQTPTNLRANYMNPANWNLTSNHQTSWTQTGDKSVKLIEYSNNVPSVKVIYED